MTDAFVDMASERLRLERICEAHADQMFAGLQNPQLYTYFSGQPPESILALRKRYSRLALGESPARDEYWHNWIMKRENSSVPIGFLQSTIKKDAPAKALLAYVLFPEYWGMGYAREGLGTVIQHLAKTAKCSRFEALIDTRNRRSIHLLESLGFAQVELIQAADFFNGASSDEFRFRLDLKSQSNT
ncbi:MAG: GNAT family N-acetyltransferase [Burkholderiales bacterium]|nr:GNAT family N-acetyltransferase [Burkholderiales bacterium]